MNLPCRFFLLQCLGIASCDATAAVTLDVADQRAIHSTALDYAQGWYEGDRERMAQSLHDSLAKRIQVTDDAGDRRLQDMDKQRLLAGNRPENAARFADAPRRAEIEILDGFGNVASVKLTMDGWVDYMHLVRTGRGEWRIVNVLWELLPADAASAAGKVDDGPGEG